MLEFLGILGVFFTFAGLCCVVGWFEAKEHRDYLETHPPISDEEYLALCDPSVDPEVALKVREILEDVSGVDAEVIYPEARLISDLGLY